MKDEHQIVLRVLEAQSNGQAADELIAQYLPFIRSETAKYLKRFPEDGQDELSIAMFAFYEAVMSYQAGKGSFLKLAATAIRNRLIDHYRREQRHTGTISLDTQSSEENESSLVYQISDDRNEAEELHDRIATKKEIQKFTGQLQEFGLSLSDIADNCPKQGRTLTACMQVLDYARQNPDLLNQLVSTKKLPLSQLTEGAGADRKTLERHRKYIVAILLAYTNGFDIIRGHLSMIKRKEALRV